MASLIYLDTYLTLLTNPGEHGSSRLQKDGRSVPVPVHRGRELGIGLIRKIEKQTGVKLT
jgi:predicted RNA binding protein YcfA (HicA-like mRNA interferase family)